MGKCIRIVNVGTDIIVILPVKVAEHILVSLFARTKHYYLDIFLAEFGRAMREDYVYGRGPYDDYNKDKKKQDRKPKHELRALNRQLIEKWLRGPIAGKLLQLSDTDDVIDRLRKMARQYETDLMILMR